MTYPGKQAVKRLDVSVTGGTGTGTLTNQWDIARRVRIIPPSETTSYDFTIKDGEGDLIILRNGAIGTTSEQLELSMGICSTINITNSSSNGTFKCKFDLH